MKYLDTLLFNLQQYPIISKSGKAHSMKDNFQSQEHEIDTAQFKWRWPFFSSSLQIKKYINMGRKETSYKGEEEKVILENWETMGKLCH